MSDKIEKMDRFDKSLLNVLVCPVSKTGLVYNPDNEELISYTSNLAYPIEAGVPLLAEQSARVISLEEKEQYLAQQKGRNL